MNELNARLITAYEASRNMGRNTTLVYENAMKSWDTITGCALSKAGRIDVQGWYTAAGSGMSTATIVTYATKLRILHAYALGDPEDDELVARVHKIWRVVPFDDLNRRIRKEERNRDKVLTGDELNELLRVARHPRVKAFVAVLFESACRKGEVLDLRIRDLAFGDTYTEVKVKGKTGERTVPLVYSVPYLRSWIQVHPDRRPDQWLWVVERNGKLDQMKESTPNHTLNYIAGKTGIRHVHPHMFRHTKLTELAKADLSEYKMKSFAGWTPNSRMAERYIHLSGRDHIGAVLEAQGFEQVKQEKPAPLLHSEHCPHCDAVTGPGMAFCSACGYVLDPALRSEKPSVDEEIDRRLDEKFREWMEKYGLKPPDTQRRPAA